MKVLKIACFFRQRVLYYASVRFGSHRCFFEVMKVQKVLAFGKKNAVVLIALTAAIVSMLLVPPDDAYLGYFDVKTLCCLFGTLAVVCALKNIHFFAILARRIMMLTGDTRTAAIVLIYITFIGSMIIANDMALITFLPLGYYVFSTTGRKNDVATVFILQNIAANLGGMLTPFGNPQNLYLYAKYNIPTGEFMGIMLLPFIVSIILVTACCFLIQKQSLRIAEQNRETLPVWRTVLYIALFTLTILMVFRVLEPLTVIGIVVVVLLIVDRKALKRVDYGLLFTFVFFFVFAGNMGRVPVVSNFFKNLMEGSTLLTAVLSCQVISNVPSAILLSQFTENYASLLVGVNIGGAGTLIASLASLITFREYSAHYKENIRGYMLRFTALNFGFLAILTVISLLQGR